MPHAESAPAVVADRALAIASPPLLVVRAAMIQFEMLTPLDAPALDEHGAAIVTEEETLRAEAEKLSEELFGVAGDASAATNESARRARVAMLAVRRDVYNGREPPAARLATVCAAAPPDLAARLVAHVARVCAARERRSRFRGIFGAERDRTRAALADLVGRTPILAEGLWLAGRTLADHAQGLADTPPDRWSHEERHTAAKALSYLARAAAKTSPSGVFCATALGDWDTTARVSGENDLVRVDLLLSVAEARKVTASLALDPAMRDAIVPRPNPTLREDGDGWTFWRPASPRRPTDAEVRTRIAPHPVVRSFLEAVRHGWSATGVIADVSARCGGDAGPFYESLVERGLLIGEAEIPYAARRPLADLAAAARTAGARPSWLEDVETIEADVALAAGVTPDARRALLERAGARLESLPHVRRLSRDELFRLDAATGIEIGLPGGVLPELRAALDWYARLFTALYPERLVRASYGARFLERFPADTDVPLLDVYHGVFEPRAERRPVGFVDPGRVARRVPGLDEAQSAYASLRAVFARAAREAEETGLPEVDLATLGAGEPAWDAMRRESPRVSAGVLFQIAARDAAAVGAGDYRVCMNGLYPGAGLSVARLATLHGDPIVREVRDGWAWLERPGTVVAEVTYMHGGRTANAGLRPSIFRYEIELPGDKTSPGVEVIPLADLVVRYDAGRERFVLRSLARGVEVLPIVTSGVSPEGFVAFLLAIGQQGVQPLGYMPGFDVDDVRAWPRFRLGRVVVFRRRWVFRGADLPGPARAVASDPDADTYLALARWRVHHRLPRRVFVHTQAAHKPFYVDLASPLFAEPLLGAIRAAGPEPTLYVTEMLPGADEMWVRDGRGRYATEFLVHLSNVGRTSSS